MAKTHRNRRHKPAKKNRNIHLAVVEKGARIAVNGHRSEPEEVQPNAKARPVFIGRVYTGVPRGKTYPYAGAKRGGAVPAAEEKSLLRRIMQ